MRASEVLQRCLVPALSAMHALRARTLLLAVEALLAGRRLVLIDLARSWPGAERVRAPLKRLDRLLGNRRLHAEREVLHAAMVPWLLRGPQPVIVVDWCRLKPNGQWHLLRAAVPVGGRTLTVLDMVFPERMQGSPQAEALFLRRLATLVPAGVRPILVTDAGYRAPWCRAVTALGWDWVTRVRNRTLVQPHAAADPACWLPSTALYPLACRQPRTLGVFDIARYQPLTVMLVLHATPARGRRELTLGKRRARNKRSLACAKREREPWLLAHSPQLTLHARQIVSLYARRMQIELAFRDLKSHRFGQAFEDSLTRCSKRIEVLLLLHTLATFAAWLAGLVAQAQGANARLDPHRSTRKLYSSVRLGWEALVRRWIEPRVGWLDLLHRPPERVLAEMAVAG